MRKAWNNAELVELDITATAGGPVNSPEFDGDDYFDEAAGLWGQHKGKRLS